MHLQKKPRNFNIAGSHKTSSSPNKMIFSPENIDISSIKLLNDKEHLIYDGERIRWTQELRFLKNFVVNILGLGGPWESSGGSQNSLQVLISRFNINMAPK